MKILWDEKRFTADTTTDMGKRLLIGLLAIYVLESLFFVLFGDVTYDEGWYLYASKLVYRGKLLYLDFPYFQAPLLPYIYGLPQLLLGPSVMVGRFTSFISGLLTVILTIRTTEKLAGSGAAAVALLCFVSSSYALFHLNYVGNLSLSTCLATLSAYALISNVRDLRMNVLSALAACLATAVRLSFAPLAVLVVMVIIVANRSRSKNVIATVTTAVISSLICFGPFLFTSIDKTLFNILFSQIGRRTQYGVPLPGPSTSWAWWFTSGSLFALAVGTLLMLILLAAPRVIVKGMCLSQRDRKPIYLFLFGAASLAYFPNLLPGDIYPNYLVPPLPFMAILAGAGTVLAHRRLARRWRPLLMAGSLASLIWGSAFSLLFLPTIASLTRPKVIQSSQVSRYIATAVPTGRRLFTFQTFLAVQADREVTSGAEMSYFSYLPLFSEELCRRYHLLNDSLIEQELSSMRPGAVILSDFDVFLLREQGAAAKGPVPPRTEDQLLSLFPELRGRYRLDRIIPLFGEWDNNLYIFLPIH